LVLFWRVIRRRWYLIVIPIIIVGAVVAPDFFDNGPAVSGGFTTTVRYTAAQELDALPNRDGDFQDVWLAAELTVDAFTEWVRTNKFAEEVALVTARNGLEINPAALSIAADNARSIGQIFISWSDEAQLAVIANAVIEVLSERNQAYFPQLGGVSAQVRLLDEPVITPAPPPLADRYAPLVRMAFAVIIGVGIAFAVEYLDPRLHRREDLESMGFKVIATIPRK
jgi:capsular polysaccharide biosynthesis protein